MKLITAQFSRALLLFLVSFMALASLGRADELRLLWQLAPGDRPYISTGDYNQRGLSYNPVTGNLLLVDRTGGANLYVLDGATGAELRVMNTDSTIISGSSPGGFALNMMGVADDGVVYAGNLTVNGPAVNYKLYRWANDSSDAIPEVAYDGDPGAGVVLRWGDSMDVRGAGTNTQVILGSRAGTQAAILTTTDGTTFTATLVNTPSMAAGHLGVAFGAGNTYWGKVNNSPLNQVQFNLATGQGALLQSHGPPAIPNSVAIVGVQAVSNLLGAIAIDTPDNLQLYDISDPASGPILLVRTNAFPDNDNANAVGSVDFGTNRIYALDSNNGIVAFAIVRSLLPTPPSINTQPQSQTVLPGGNATFSVTASGTPPLRYQWRFNGTNDIAGATSSSFTLTNVQPANAGNYQVIVSNLVGTTASSNAVLTVATVTQGDVMTLAWQATITDPNYPYLKNDNSHRGLTFNRATTNLIVVSRTGGLFVNVLDAATGQNLRTMSVDGIAGGTFALNMIGAGDDGAVYGANLVTDSSAVNYTIYKWDDDSAGAVPNVAFQGDPSNDDASTTNRRFGDSFDVRGAGPNTQILAASRAGTIAVIFTTTDGATFTPNIINTDATAGDLGLGVAFGAGNTFYGKASGRALRHIAFDLATGQGTTLTQFSAADIPTLITSIGFDPATGHLGAVALETPDNLRLYQINAGTNPPALLDQQLFSSDNANVNGTGSVDFGGGYLFGLDTNNGILAMRLSGPPDDAHRLAIRRDNASVIVSWTGNGRLQSAASVAGPYNDVPGATTPHTQSTAGISQRFWRVAR